MDEEIAANRNVDATLFHLPNCIVENALVWMQPQNSFNFKMLFYMNLFNMPPVSNLKCFIDNSWVLEKSAGEYIGTPRYDKEKSDDQLKMMVRLTNGHIRVHTSTSHIHVRGSCLERAH